MAENKSLVLYNNLLRQSGATLSYSGTGVVGREEGNAIDWRDFSLFEVDASAITELEITLPDGGTFDSWSIYVANYTGTGNQSISLEYESSPSTFTPVDSQSLAGGKLTFESISQITVAAGRKVKFIFDVGTATMLIRQLVVGNSLEFERGQWDGVTPPNFTQGAVVDNIISVNGSVIARNLRHLERSASINLSHIDKDWMRTNFEPFQVHATRYAFIYKWSPVEYPNEIAFSVAKDIVAPQHDRYRFMSVSMPLRCLIADSNVL